LQLLSWRRCPGIFFSDKTKTLPSLACPAGSLPGLWENDLCTLHLCHPQHGPSGGTPRLISLQAGQRGMQGTRALPGSASKGGRPLCAEAAGLLRVQGRGPYVEAGNLEVNDHYREMFRCGRGLSVCRGPPQPPSAPFSPPKLRGEAQSCTATRKPITSGF
jgi:hypothetical protein